ncbi:MAG: hypothetical protein PUA86_10670 [Clostridiaceae bacterium]|nr:hypothetical protein [Clostridiaceae bacterium]
MGRRRSGGCLYAVIFFIALILSILLLAVMFSSVKSTDGGTLLTEILERIGIGNKSEDSSGEKSEGSGAGRPGLSGQNSPEDETSDSGIADLPSTDAIRIEVTQEKLRELLEAAMEDSFPLTLDEVVISADSTLTFSGRAERDRFLEMLEDEGSALGALERMTLQLAPEEIAFSARVGVTYDAAEGTIALEPQELTVAELSIPTALLPDALVEKLNTALTDFFATYGQTPAGVTLYDGYMRIYFE